MFQRDDYIIFGLFFFLVVLYIVRAVMQFNHSTDGSEELAPVLEQTAEVKKENAELHIQILESTSLATLEKKANALGYRHSEHKDYEYIK